jgi:hypothetical protein
VKQTKLVGDEMKIGFVGDADELSVFPDVLSVSLATDSLYLVQTG